MSEQEVADYEEEIRIQVLERSARQEKILREVARAETQRLAEESRINTEKGLVNFTMATCEKRCIGHWVNGDGRWTVNTYTYNSKGNIDHSCTAINSRSAEKICLRRAISINNRNLSNVHHVTCDGPRNGSFGSNPSWIYITKRTSNGSEETLRMKTWSVDFCETMADELRINNMGY